MVKNTEVELLPEFTGVNCSLHDSRNKDKHFVFDGPLHLAFFDFHFTSTDGDTVFALDLMASRLVRLSPNWATPIPLPGEAAFLTFTENRYVPIPRQQEDGKLLVYGTLGRKTEQDSLCPRKIRRALLRRVDVSARQKSWRNHLAARG